ncbi:hypothetical protein KDN24_06625 [Bacillus sp. Bva_UNVM-123]|uniref:hypothetical protein n=1 Tax=Bacillus sp. Bva_UNVM-123 TaxID=2829798 RepID=UPI00391F8D15
MKKYSLRVLQAAYLPITLREQVSEQNEKCVLCWKSNCECNTNINVETDYFLNLTEEELQYV